MKILFLDIDGVLNSRAYDRKRNLDEQTNIDETRLPLLKEIIDATDAKIVLSSTWRQHWDKDSNRCGVGGRYINRIFAKFGLAIYDKTPNLGIGALRRDEIQKWLDDIDQDIESFVIIDDYRYGWGELSNRFVKTDPNFSFGLENEQVERAIKILDRRADA